MKLPIRKVRSSVAMALATAALTLGACGPGSTMADVQDVPTTDTPADGQGNPGCTSYCTTIMTNCRESNAQYASMQECVDYCNTSGWPAGTAGATSGNSLACRTYHGGAPAASEPATHCPHGGPSGGNVCGTLCENYCQLMASHCTGANSQYTDMATCMTACATIPATGMLSDRMGNTLQCRLYHGGYPAATDPATHCPHAGPTGGGVCGNVMPGYNFRTDAPAMYRRVDRMGMPAVATALVSSAMRNGYNDANPVDDAMGTFAGELITNLTGLHTALDDDLRTANLAPCSMTTMIGMLPECLGQTVGMGGPTVASLVLPDTLNINPSAAAGFPNGRRLEDPVIDVTLSVILLRLGGTCGGGTCGPTTLVGTNPRRNDVANGVFLTEFPYLQPARAP